MSKTLKITSGPSREELFDGLRLFAEKRPVGFVIENNGRQMTPIVWMHGIEAEDGSGQSWNIKFSIAENFVGEMPYPIDVSKPVPPVNSVTVTAYYSTKTRTGTITVE